MPLGGPRCKWKAEDWYQWRVVFTMVVKFSKFLNHYKFCVSHRYTKGTDFCRRAGD